MRIRGVIIGGVSTALGVGLGLLATQPAHSAPAKVEGAAAAAQPPVYHEAEPDLAVEAKPDAVVAGKNGRTRIRYSAELKSRAPRDEAAGLTLEVLEHNYRPVYAEDGPPGLTKKGSFSGKLQTPEGLRDGLYLARIWGATSDGTTENMNGTYQYFEVVGGNASPVTHEDYLARVPPMSPWNHEDHELTQDMIDAYKARQEQNKKKDEEVRKKLNSGLKSGGSGL